MPNHIDYNNNLSRFESAKRQVRPLHYTSLSHHIPPRPHIALSE